MGRPLHDPFLGPVKVPLSSSPRWKGVFRNVPGRGLPIVVTRIAFQDSGSLVGPLPRLPGSSILFELMAVESQNPRIVNAIYH